MTHLPCLLVNVLSQKIEDINESASLLLKHPVTHSQDFIEFCNIQKLNIEKSSIDFFQKNFFAWYEILTPFAVNQTKNETHVLWYFFPYLARKDVYALIADRSLPVTELIQKLKIDNDNMLFILNRVPHYLFWKDKNSVFLGCNQLFADSAKLRSPKDIIGKSDFDLPWSAAESLAYTIDDQEVMRSRQAKLNIEESQTIKGKQTTLLTSKVPIFDEHDEPLGVIGIYTDITKIKETQNELETQKKKAEAANIAKSNFLATISHELRTPLNGILGTLEVMQKKYADNVLSPDLKELHATALTLSSLVNDILDFSCIEQGKITLKNSSFPLQDIIDYAIKNISHTIKEKNIELIVVSNIDTSIHFNGDALRIQQVLSNLINNAVKFTHKGKISLSIDYTLVSGEMQLEFVVKDTGIGISPQQQELIFERFVQGDSKYSRRYEGLGLGLAICKELVHLMGGEISVQSEIGAGSTFTFSIPIEKTQKEIPSLTTGDVTEKTATIAGQLLIVEDNPLNSRVMQLMLSHFPITVDIVENGQDALEYISNNTYNLIFLDISLPDMDGIMIASTLRKEFTATQLPIVAITAHAYESDKAACFAAGINDVLVKPINMEQLTKQLIKWLS